MESGYVVLIAVLTLGALAVSYTVGKWRRRHVIPPPMATLPRLDERPTIAPHPPAARDDTGGQWTAALAIFLMIGGGLWALLGAANIVTVVSRETPGFAAVGLMVNGALFVFPGLVVLGIGALLYRRTGSVPTPAAPGLVACRTCRKLIAPDAPTCPHCGAPEPRPLAKT